MNYYEDSAFWWSYLLKSMLTTRSPNKEVRFWHADVSAPLYVRLLLPKGTVLDDKVLACAKYRTHVIWVDSIRLSLDIEPRQGKCFRIQFMSERRFGVCKHHIVKGAQKLVTELYPATAPSFTVTKAGL